MSLLLFLDSVVQRVVAAALANAEQNTAVNYYGVNVHLDNCGRPFYVVRREDAPWQTMIPGPLKDHVVQVSWWCHLPEGCCIVPGRYGFETAEAVVTSDDGKLRAKFYGPNLLDVYSLRHWLPAGRAVEIERWEVPEPEPSDAPEQPIETTPETGTADDGRVYTPFTASDNNIRFACGECGARYMIVSGKIEGRVVKIRCRKCNAQLLMDGTKIDTIQGSEANNPPPETPPANN